MLTGKLGYLGCGLALGWACFSCSSDEAKPQQKQAAGTCDVAGRDTDLCRVWVQRSIACDAPTESEETLIEQCHADWEDYPNRVASCFVAELSDCAANCNNDDDCFSNAIVANDPSVVDIERYRACIDSPAATGCDDLTVGFLKECIERAHDCYVWDDLCASIVAMKQPYRAEGEACLARTCTEMEGCLYTAMGRTKKPE